MKKNIYFKPYLFHCRMNQNQICLVSIFKMEESFAEEWLAYHRLIGIEHFFIYDDDKVAPLSKLLFHHSDVTIINWAKNNTNSDNKNNQVAAYTHALKNFAHNYKWVAFLDCDEFLVLKKHKNVKDFINSFPPPISSICLNWHVFGHSGYYNDPPDLVTTSLIRRMKKPGKNIKSITLTAAIASIASAHFCNLKFGLRVDANKKVYDSLIYPGKTAIAHINHYQCRSFYRWMQRAERGDVIFSSVTEVPKEHTWRMTAEGCLKQFVTTVALDKNEFVDKYLVKYRNRILKEIDKLKTS